MTSEVNLDRVRLLVADLRTPGIRQGRGWLTQQTVDADTKELADRDCCLGRACKVAIANGLAGLEAHYHHGTKVAYVFLADDGSGDWTEEAETSLLPGIVRDWYGFSSDAPQLLGPDGLEYQATQLNDELRWNFDQIATAFEVTYLDGTYPADAMTWPGMPEDPNPEP